LKHTKIAESMNNLFEEYARSVLNLETTGLPIPQFPNVFSPFLQKESKSRTKALEIKRKRIQNMIKMLQEEIKNLDKRLAVADKEKQNINHKGYTSNEETKIDQET